MTRLLFAAACLAAGAASAQEAPKQATIQTDEARGVKVYFLDIPWGPETFAGMERGGDSYYNRRTWPFARLETRVPVTLDGTRIPAGNYALVFHPNDATNRGMSLEVLAIDVPEFLRSGNVMTPTPSGRSVHKAPISFETVEETTPTLSISLDQGSDGAVALRIRYGNRTLRKELRF